MSNILSLPVYQIVGFFFVSLLQVCYRNILYYLQHAIGSLDKYAALGITTTCNFYVIMEEFKNSQVAFVHLHSRFKSTNSRPRICLVSKVLKCPRLAMEVAIL